MIARNYPDIFTVDDEPLHLYAGGLGSLWGPAVFIFGAGPFHPAAPNSGEPGFPGNDSDGILKSMIRGFRSSDMDAVIAIWLDASIGAHDFVAKNFWRSRVIEMREVYIPASETYVYEEGGCIRGFVCLVDETLAALFVSPCAQGRGIGQKLVEKSKHVRQNLYLAVYKENQKSVDFYKRCGFKSVKEQIDKYTGHSEIVMVFNPCTPARCCPVR